MAETRQCKFCWMSSLDKGGFTKVGIQDVHVCCEKMAREHIYYLIARLEDWGFPVTVYFNGADKEDEMNIDERDWYHDKLDEARELVCDLFVQACQVAFDHEKQEGTYDHMAISTYEEAQDALIEWGMIRPDQCKGVQE